MTKRDLFWLNVGQAIPFAALFAARILTRRAARTTPPVSGQR